MDLKYTGTLAGRKLLHPGFTYAKGYGGTRGARSNSPLRFGKKYDQK
jgi:hypothetical protein